MKLTGLRKLMELQESQVPLQGNSCQGEEGMVSGTSCKMCKELRGDSFCGLLPMLGPSFGDVAAPEASVFL